MIAESQAWNIFFGARDSDDGLMVMPGRDPVVPRPDSAPDGWAGGDGPAIRWEHWPRGSSTGLPMMHVLTLRLPEEYQRQGPAYPGIAFFQGDGQFGEGNAPEGVPDSDDPFLHDLALVEEHPGLRRREDLIGGEFALIWLREYELQPTPIHGDLREPGTHADTSEGLNAWDNRDPVTDVWLLPRRDPNAGKAPVELPGGEVSDEGYLSPFTEEYDMQPWAEQLVGECHLGGTSLPVQMMPDGLTPWYLEIEEIGGTNFGGGGNAQIDLESEAFNWACG